MCQEAIVDNAKGRKYVETIGELAKALGIKVSRVPIQQGYGDFGHKHDSCLCPVDFVHLANLRGLTMTRLGWDESHWGEIVLTDNARE